MTKKHIGMGLIVVGAAAAAAAVAKMFSGSPQTAFLDKLPTIPTSHNGANAAIGVGLALLGFYLKA